jgi:NAD(P)H dehydrogenase (quinone)
MMIINAMVKVLSAILSRRFEVEIPMIVVTGATGQLGHAIVKKLATILPASEIAASCRDPLKAADVAALGVRVRHGDFAAPESLVNAFEGATQVLIVSSNAGATGGDPRAQHDVAIKAAIAAGARRIVYTSHMAANAHSAFPPMRDHAATEYLLANSGIAWTALRNGFYSASGIAMMGDAFKSGYFEITQDGKFSWAAHADLAEAAALILTQEEKYQGPTPPLTGPQSLDFADLASLASAVLGKAIAKRIISEDGMRAKMATRGAPPSSLAMVLGLYQAANDGEFGQVDASLEQLLGRPLISMRDLIAQTVVN